MNEKVIQLSKEILKKHAERARVKSILRGNRNEGKIAGAITPLEAPLEAAVMIHEAGG